MIRTSTQLKAKIRNVSGGDSKVAMTMMRVYFMERFLERVSMSPYADKFILKGGMLVSSLIGLRSRATMDIDTTVQALTLTEDTIESIVTEIGSIRLEDNVFFDIVSIETIMDEFEYPGVRIHMEAKLDKLKQPIKIDVSTDDVITPRAVEHNYQLMFEDREIDLLSYNVETLLAEKAQTILSRGLANTRMRDFYDVFELIQRRDYSKEVFKNAFRATCLKRGTELGAMQIQKTLETIASSNAMETMWNRFGNSNYYVEEVAFDKVVAAVESLLAIELLQ